MSQRDMVAVPSGKRQSGGQRRNRTGPDCSFIAFRMGLQVSCRHCMRQSGQAVAFVCCLDGIHHAGPGRGRHCSIILGRP